MGILISDDRLRRMYPGGRADAAGVRFARFWSRVFSLGLQPRRWVTLEEVPVADRAPILRRYLQQVPGGRPHMPVAPDAPLAGFEAFAARYPAFRVVDERR